jgi:hypothetical protein
MGRQPKRPDGSQRDGLGPLALGLEAAEHPEGSLPIEVEGSPTRSLDTALSVKALM